MCQALRNFSTDIFTVLQMLSFRSFSAINRHGLSKFQNFARMFLEIFQISATSCRFSSECYRNPRKRDCQEIEFRWNFSRNLTEMLSCKFQLTSFENTPRIHFKKSISKFTSSAFRAMNQKTSAIFAAAPSARRGFRPARPARRRAAAPARSRPY